MINSDITALVWIKVEKFTQASEATTLDIIQ
jgi:hypothetical protein